MMKQPPSRWDQVIWVKSRFEERLIGASLYSGISAGFVLKLMILNPVEQGPQDSS